MFDGVILWFDGVNQLTTVSTAVATAMAIQMQCKFQYEML